jgi:hypothetical protein
MIEEFQLKCPVCEGIQHCPCDSCRERQGEQVVWKWDKLGELSSCGHCGYQMSSDQWLDEQSKQHKEWKRVQDAINVSNYTPYDQEDDGEID